VFVHNNDSGETVLISHAPDGTGGNDDSALPDFSAEREVPVAVRGQRNEFDSVEIIRTKLWIAEVC
jgi:hypothetical protein